MPETARAGAPVRADEAADLRGRILATALGMFNAATVQRVTSRDIAGSLGISPGNLTYHFGRKNEIVDTLVDQFESELTSVLAEVPALSAEMEGHVDYLLRQLQVVWRYRFYFNSISFLSSDDAAYKARFNRLRRHLVEMSARAYQRLITTGSVKPVAEPNSLALVMENFWYLWFSLIRLYAIVAPAGRVTEKGFYRFAAMHLYAYLEPYYRDEVKRGFRAQLQQRLE